MLKTMVAKYKLANQQASSVHKYPAIIEEDMKKIRIYFDQSRNIAKRNNVQFNLLLWFSWS